MLLCTNKANIVFCFVDEKFGNRDISPSRGSSPAGWLPQVLCSPQITVGASLLAIRAEQSINNSLTFPKSQIHRQPPIHRRFPGLGKHPFQQFHLLTAQ